MTAMGTPALNVKSSAEVTVSCSVTGKLSTCLAVSDGTPRAGPFQDDAYLPVSYRAVDMDRQTYAMLVSSKLKGLLLGVTLPRK